MKLTENFYLSEFTKSSTAIRHGIRNEPRAIQVDNLILLCKHVLQPLRDWYGKPIRINSGFRSPGLNTYLGGAKSSQHMFGEAADIDTLRDNKKLFDYIKDNLTFDQLISEFGTEDNPGWIHVSYCDKHNRGEVLRAEKINGKVTYTRIS